MKNNALNRDEKTGVIYKKWTCPSPRAVFLLVHGLGGYADRWDFLANSFLQNNISSYAIDLRGFGQTGDLKGHIDSFDIYFRDIQSICDIIKRENSGKKIFLIGESMGALISFVFVALKADLFRGLICISPAFKSTLKFSLAGYLKTLIFLIFNPKKQLKMPFDSAMCTRDIDCQKAMDIDEREHRFATPKLLLNIVLAQMRASSLKNKIKIPTLFLLAGDSDQLVDSKESKIIFKNLETEDKEIIQYKEMYHALSIELGRERVFNDILRWIDRRI